ncbi:MAG: hypothetical protein ACREDQ_10325 [Limisphaerales bacterium]
MDTFIGVAGAFGAIYALLLVFVPRLRARRERYWGGRITCLGASLFFGGSAAAYLFWNHVTERSRWWFFLPMFVGFLVIAVGKALDKHSGADVLPATDTQTLARQRRLRLPVLALFGLFVVILLQLLFHR